MKKVISLALALGMAVMMMVGLTGCGGGETKPAPDNSSPSSKTDTVDNKTNPVDDKIKLVSDTVNGMTLNVPDDLSEFVDTKGIMRAKNDAGTASIAISAPQDAGGGVPEAYTKEAYQSTQMTTYSDVTFLEFKNNATVDGASAVYAHAKGTNPNGVKLELYNYLIFFENGNYQSVVFVFSEGSGTFLEKNIQSIISSMKLAK
ncbi:MAG: hypothetical protein RR436_06470 [Clostridia bacterium]